MPMSEYSKIKGFTPTELSAYLIKIVAENRVCVLCQQYNSCKKLNPDEDCVMDLATSLVTGVGNCPFCGGGNVVSASDYDGYHIECLDCYAKGPSAAENQDAINLWNEATD